MVEISKIKRSLPIILRTFLSPFILTYPKNKKIWIFGSLYGKGFMDNSKYFYLFMLKNHPEIKSIWISPDPIVKKEVEEVGGECHSPWSFKGIYSSLRAKYSFTSYGINDLNPVFSIGSKRIELGHGLGPKSLKINKFSLRNFIRIISFSNPKYLIVTSNFVSKNLNKFFKISEKNLIPVGYPRNDSLFQSEIKINRDITKKIGNKKIIFYLPTWRNKKIDLFKKYKFDLNEIRSYLEKNNLILIIKGHHANKSSLKNKNKSKNILILDSEDLRDIYPLVKKSSILITDYSSIYLDFILLDRPIIFSPFDIKDLEKDYFSFNYEQVTPGEKIYGWSHFVETLKKIKKKDEFKEERQRVANLFHKFQDGKSCERMYNFILKQERDSIFIKLFRKNKEYVDGKATNKFADGKASERCVKKILKLVGKN